MPVTRNVISSFGRVLITKTLSSNNIAGAQTPRFSSFIAGEKWAKNSVRRQGIVSKALYGEGGGIDREAAKDCMEASQEAARHYALDNIFNVDEAGLFHKDTSRRTYIEGFDGRQLLEA